MIDFRPVTPAAESGTASHRLRNLPCTDISNRKNSSSTSTSKRTEDDKSQFTSVPSVDQVEAEKTGRQRARRSLHYDNNENILDDATTEYVFSRKRPISPEYGAVEQPSKRRRTDCEDGTLELTDAKPVEINGAESERRLSQKMSTVIIGRKSGQWKVSTPTQERTATPRRDGTALLDTPSKSVTFHDSVVGGDHDDVNGAEMQTPKGTPRSSKRPQKLQLTPKCESPVQTAQSAGKITPRARRSICLTPKNSQKGTPAKSANTPSTPTNVTPLRSSARIASALSSRKGNKATPRTSEKKRKDLPVRRLLSASSPGTGRILRPRTPKSYKFRVDEDDDDDLYRPDSESSDAEFSGEEECAVKKTPTRKASKTVQNL